MKEAKYLLYQSLIEHYLTELKKRLEKDLLSMTLFGSVARERAALHSDIDLLSLVRRKDLRLQKEVTKINVASYNWPEMELLRKRGMWTKIYNILKTEKELKENPLILLDILEEGKILYDPFKKMEEILVRLRERLKVLKTEKVVLPDGRWYWDLKPDWKPKELVEIRL